MQKHTIGTGSSVASSSGLMATYIARNDLTL